jgi:transcriptional regulator with XRE-family HTH domain
VTDIPGRQQLTGYRLRDPDHLVAALRQAQISRGPTLARVADQLGCARSTVSGLLAGNHTAAIDRWVDLADALGYDLALIPREDTDA